MNCDEAMLRACVGAGVLRDHFGVVLFSFVMFFGSCSILAAELKAINIGLKLAFEK